MSRLIIICEGQTEREFCNQSLKQYVFPISGTYIQSPLIKRSMGGIVKWSNIKKQIESHLRNESNVYVTTLIDYYGIKKRHEFPDWDIAEIESNPNVRMDILENGMYNSIDEEIRYRFIPYIQLHEFEALIFSDRDVFNTQYSSSEINDVEELDSIFGEFANPEMINRGSQTAPSKRLQRIIPGYNKIIHGSILIEEIGIEKIRVKCPRFNAWLNKISPS